MLHDLAVPQNGSMVVSKPCLQHRLALRPDLDYVCSFFDLPFKTAAKTWMDLDNKDPDLTRRRSQVAISAAVKEITGSEWLRSPLPAVLTCIRGSECAMRCTGRECSPTHMTPRHRTAPLIVRDKAARPTLQGESLSIHQGRSRANVGLVKKYLVLTDQAVQLSPWGFFFWSYQYYSCFILRI
jgi:hypothetical protein